MMVEGALSKKKKEKEMTIGFVGNEFGINQSINHGMGESLILWVAQPTLRAASVL